MHVAFKGSYFLALKFHKANGAPFLNTVPLLFVWLELFKWFESQNYDFSRWDTITTVNVWSHDGGLVSTQTLILDNIESRKLALESQEEHTMCPYLDVPFVGAKGCSYDVEHSICPTDLEYHFSGAPFTLLGADLWTCYGSINQKTKGNFFNFSSVGERRAGRCCLEQGQIPYFLFWPCL